jgi:hypothetical protein
VTAVTAAAAAAAATVAAEAVRRGGGVVRERRTERNGGGVALVSHIVDDFTIDDALALDELDPSSAVPSVDDATRRAGRYLARDGARASFTKGVGLTYPLTHTRSRLFKDGGCPMV